MSPLSMSPLSMSPSGQVQELVWGALAAQVTIVLAELGVADELAGGPRPAGAVAEAIGADAGALRRLMRAGASLGLLVGVEDDRFALTALGETLRRDSPDSARDRVLAFGTPTRWRLLGELREAVRSGRSTAREVLGRTAWEHYTSNLEEGEVFSRAMGELSGGAADAIAAIVDPREYGRIADIGGAHGELLTALLECAPESDGVLFDLPSVIDGARRRLDSSPSWDRIALAGGDFFEQVPQADLYLLMRVLHDWDDEHARRILATCRRSAAPGARMLLVEQVLPDPWIPSPAHLSDIAMLVLLGGRERTASEYGALLGATGWGVEEVCATDTPFGVLLAVALD
jgi:hypothetical protein